MGFNIQEYKLATKDDFSNGSGWLKEKLGIGDGKIFGKVVNQTKNEQYKAKKSKNSETTSNLESNNTALTNVPTSTTTPESTSSTGMYIGIGVGILAIGIVTMILIKRNK